MGASKHWGCPNIQGAFKHMGASKHTGEASKHMQASKCMGAYGHPLNMMLSLCCVCTGDIQTYGGTPFFCIILNCICHLEFLLSFFFNFTYFIHFFQNIPLSFVLLESWCVNRNSLPQCVQYIVLYFAHCCCKISFYLKSDDDLI